MGGSCRSLYNEMEVVRSNQTCLIFIQLEQLSRLVCGRTDVPSHFLRNDWLRAVGCK